jgi:hypothetical protein
MAHIHRPCAPAPHEVLRDTIQSLPMFSEILLNALKSLDHRATVAQ